MKTRYLYLALATFLCSCGSESRKDSNNGSPATEESTSPDGPLGNDSPEQQRNKALSKFGSLSFASGATLPACSPEIEGALAYLREERVFQTCEAGNWIGVSIEGKEGKEGAVGSSITGPPGQNGLSCSVSNSGLVTCGSSTFQLPNFTPQFRGVEITAEAAGANCASGGNRVVQFDDANSNGTKEGTELAIGLPQYICKDKNQIQATFFCSGLVGSTGLVFNYVAQIMETEDVYAQAAIKDGSRSISAAASYNRNSTGAASAAVGLDYDMAGIPNGGTWKLSLNRTTLVTTVVYIDSNYSATPTTWVMTSDQCASGSYPNDR